MRELKLTEALTTDLHFVEAGFKALLADRERTARELLTREGVDTLAPLFGGGLIDEGKAQQNDVAELIGHGGELA